MDERRAGEILSQNLTAIYGFAFARLFDKEKVDDLASEIVCQIMLSAKNIRNEDAFWGYAWRVAENTFRRFIRKEQTLPASAVGEENDPDGCPTLSHEETECSAEEKYLAKEEEREQIYLLRRELSLLSRTHREVCVAYYVDNKSCSEIAKEKNLSVDMVKYHLFKTRKLLKEGIGMTRTLGEKSYNPGTFRLNFWGDRNHYDNLFKRKLPGALALAAYYTPMTAEELSMEVGVSMPYLEEELDILEKAGVMLKTGTKYQTNVVILTDAYEKEFERKTKGVYRSYADALWKEAVGSLDAVRKLDFHGNDYDDNRLLFAIINMAMVRGYGKTRYRSPIGNAPALPLGSYGWIWGHDNDYQNLHFLGVCMEVWNREQTAWFSAVNYSVIKAAQRYDHSRFSDKAEAMCSAILGREPDPFNDTVPWLVENQFINREGNRLAPNFPVFDEESYRAVCDITDSMAELVSECMTKLSDEAALILAEHVPNSVRDQCGVIARIHHSLSAAALIMETLVEDGRLTVPEEKVPLCVWGVKAE